MSQATYKTAIEFVLKWEVGLDKHGRVKESGGYVNHPNDPGGETKWGIAKKSHPDEDIKNMPLERALEIYRKDYWDCYRSRGLDLDGVPPDYAVVMFDTGINCGVNRAFNWHTKSIKEKDPTKVLLGLRDKHYFDLVSNNKEKFGVFYKGWINRLNDLKKLVDIIRAET